MSSLRFSRVPAIDTALKLVTVAVAMFAFVFVRFVISVVFLLVRVC